ncbi:hypothetical protein AXG93_4012s1190 [Marchantia polymorpha subsp. ruderalis]|uniref:RRM domain-containing protein n=1 Tax=Marchantia polymorpha subsp. ruderalis TaxID=1480154 RepID=A0A176VJQ0_MARPO|nr:hypothetical protein AXG93_4012s1190 [Marchantia polymorpha subsp. ruderalis]
MSHFGRAGPPDIRDTYSLLVLNITFNLRTIVVYEWEFPVEIVPTAYLWLLVSWFLVLVSPGTSADDLYPLFDRYGKVVDIFIPRDRRTGESRGFAFVRYKHAEEAQKAIERLDGRNVDGRDMVVQYAKYGRDMESISQQRLRELSLADIAERLPKAAPSIPVDQEAGAQGKQRVLFAVAEARETLVLHLICKPLHRVAGMGETAETAIQDHLKEVGTVMAVTNIARGKENASIDLAVVKGMSEIATANERGITLVGEARVVARVAAEAEAELECTMRSVVVPKAKSCRGKLRLLPGAKVLDVAQAEVSVEVLHPAFLPSPPRRLQETEMTPLMRGRGWIVHLQSSKVYLQNVAFPLLTPLTIILKLLPRSLHTQMLLCELSVVMVK